MMEIEPGTPKSIKIVKTYSRKCLTTTQLHPQPHSIKLPVKALDQARTLTSCKRKRPSTDSTLAAFSALQKAKEVQGTLDPTFPSFARSMVASNVATGHWLGIPTNFCKSYLPQNDPKITLVDENGKEYPTKFIFENIGLSAGWRRFALDHKLVQGDALVFQLFEPSKFKVYITRAYSSSEIDVAHGLLDLDSRSKKNDAGSNMARRDRKRRQKSVLLSSIQGNDSNTSVEVPTGRIENESDEVVPELVQGITYSGSMVESTDMGNLDSFTIKVNDLVIDSEISDYVRSKYYELCCSQKALLHEHILKVMNPMLVAGIIEEVVTIADSIIASNPTTLRDDFPTWERILIAFEEFGMNVGFLLYKLQRLVSIAYKSEQAIKAKRDRETMFGQEGIADEIRCNEAKLVELKETSRRLEAEVKSLKGKAEDHEMKFQVEAKAPW